MKKIKVKIKDIAETIVILEKEYQKGDKNSITKLDQLVSSLSIEDMLKIDEYISENNLFDKIKNL